MHSTKTTSSEATSPGYESVVGIHNKPHITEGFVEQTLSPSIFPPSPADTSSDYADSHMPALSALAIEENRILRDLFRGSPGDQSKKMDRESPEQRQLARKRSNYYEDAFASREPLNSARERVSKESMIMADVRTNVIIQDEYTFITDLSYNLSTRYQRPDSCVLVTLTHSACLIFGGSFDPAYILSITALPSQLQPATNKRNAVLLQRFMEDALGVVPERGLVRFIPIAEENLATNGKTVAGEIEELEKESSDDSASVRRTLSRGKNKHSARSMTNLRISSPLPTHDEDITPPVSSRSIGDPLIVPAILAMPTLATEKSAVDQKVEKMQKIGRRRSFMTSIFGKVA